MHATAVVIGAGHAGLAMSRCLAERSIDHVVLERGEVANSWKTERWDSLRLLTPNWQARLPGYCDDDGDPEGFRTMPQTVAMIERYAAWIAAPVHTHTTVRSVRATDEGFVVRTDQGEWHCKLVVLASGACNIATVPACAQAIAPSIASLTPMTYRNPAQLEPGGVLVVGASASGVQIADELARAQHEVVLATGEHIRMPRSYRGRDIQWWLDAAGIQDERAEDVDDLLRARRLPSLQLASYPDRRMVDLNSLQALGVQVVGRLAGVRDGRLQFSGSLANHVALSELKMNRMLARLDAWAARHGIDGDVTAAERPEPVRVDAAPALSLDLAARGIRTIIWATGYRPDYRWLEVPVLDRKGALRHDRGAVDWPGLYALGLPFMRRRKSTLIDGAADDARALATHMAVWLDRQAGVARKLRSAAG